MAINFDNVQRLPLEPGNVGGAFQEFPTVLDGTEFIVRARWNTRDAAWYLSLFDAADDPIFQGIKIVQGVALGRRVTDERMPGVFLASDLNDPDGTGGVDAGYDDLGERVVVDFYPFAEWFADSE
jgi:hypothetical protein